MCVCVCVRDSLGDGSVCSLLTVDGTSHSIHMLKHAPFTCQPVGMPPKLHPHHAFTLVGQTIVENLAAVASVCNCHIRNIHMIERCFFACYMICKL